MCINSSSLDWSNISSEVPQNSLLGFYNTFINDLDEDGLSDLQTSQNCVL